jgi:hypothetical protein
MASGIQDLEWFARESLLRGLGKQEIRKALLEAGWTEDQVSNALGAYADVACAVPVPKPRPQLSRALLILDAPSVQRQRKMDGVHVQDLSTIASYVNGYFTRHKTLPADLGTLAKEPGYRVAQSDPESGKPYDYQILESTTYRLCADFATDSTSESSHAYPNVKWVHTQGHHCFDRNTGKSE